MLDAPAIPRCTGVYRGVVTIDVDPLGQGRVKAVIPQLLGDDESDWCYPAFSIGMSETPIQNDPIWIIFEGGDPAHPVYFGSWKTLGIPVLTEENIPSGIIGTDQIADFAITLTKFGDAGTHHFDTPVLASNSPSAGYVSWGAFRMVYNGVEYDVVAGNTNDAYIWWPFGATALSHSNTPPALTVNDCLMILNKSGIAFLAPATQLIDGSLLVTGSIGTNQLAANSITATQIAAGAINGMTITGNTITGATITGTVINGGTINGGTIVGAQFSTAATGARITLNAGGSAGAISIYSGDNAELGAATILAGTSGSGTTRQPSLWFVPGIYNSADLGLGLGTTPAYIVLTGDNVSGVGSIPTALMSSRGTLELLGRTNSVYQPRLLLWDPNANGSSGEANLTGDLAHTGSGNLILQTNNYLLQQGWPTTSNWCKISGDPAGINGNFYMSVPYGNAQVRDGGSGYMPILASAFTVSSAEKFKRDVQPLAGALEEVLGLRPVKYRNVKGGPRPTFPGPFHRWHTGTHRSLIAEEVLSSIPDAIVPHEETGEPEGLSMMTLLATTIGAIQELHAEIEHMKENKNAT